MNQERISRRSSHGAQLFEKSV